MLGSLYTVIILGFLVYIFVSARHEIRSWLAMEVRLRPVPALMSLGILVNVGLVLFLPVYANAACVRYLLPLLSFLPYFWVQFLQWIKQQWGLDLLKAVLIVWAAFLLLHNHLFFTQNDLYSAAPNRYESAELDILHQLEQRHITLSYAEYWIAYKFTFLARGAHASLPGPYVQRFPFNDGPIARRLSAAPIASIAYIFDRSSIMDYNWTQYAQQHHIAYQQYQNYLFTMIYDMAKPNNFFQDVDYSNHLRMAE